MEIETQSQIDEKEKDEASDKASQMQWEKSKANETSDSEDEDDESTILTSVKKHQSKQSCNTFLMPDDLANEIEINNGKVSIKKTTKGNGNITIAPGEGKIPTNLLRDEDFDVKAFPRHHPNGQFGLHHKRDLKLSSQMYFNQRLLNVDERFSTDPCYLFMSCYYLERQMIENQIDVAGVRGPSSMNENGERKVHLNDIFSVFAKIKGTPKFWQVARNDLVAKVKQLGPFHVFFTFSCGEMRWSEVFISLLMRKGYNIEIPVEWRRR